MSILFWQKVQKEISEKVQKSLIKRACSSFSELSTVIQTVRLQTSDLPARSASAKAGIRLKRGNGQRLQKDKGFDVSSAERPGREQRNWYA